MFAPTLSFGQPGQRMSLNANRKQGKVAELKAELNTGHGKKDKGHLAKKIALKKIVANMTMSNNDMVALFADVVMCMEIQNLEIKKMYASIRAVVDWRPPATLFGHLLTNAQVLPLPRQLRPDETRHRLKSTSYFDSGMA